MFNACFWRECSKKVLRKSSQPSAVSKRQTICHLLKGSLWATPGGSVDDGIIKYQPATASAAAWRGSIGRRLAERSENRRADTERRRAFFHGGPPDDVVLFVAEGPGRLFGDRAREGTAGEARGLKDAMHTAAPA